MLASSKVFLSDPGVRSRFLRGYFNHKEDPLYVPFVTDAERELASIQFWVAKNTNLKEVSISLRRAYLPFWSFSFDCYIHFSKGCAVSSYSDADPVKRKRCQVYGGKDYNYKFLEDVKTSTENAVPLEQSIIESVKEIEPWGIYEQTAWDYVRSMVEEEERYKLLKKSTVTRESLRSVYFEYQNRSVKMVMLPVAIAQNNHIHDFFTIFISGVTGIPSGLSMHKRPHFQDVPFYRLDKYFIPLCKYGYQKLMDAFIRYHSSKEQRKMQELQDIIASSNDISVISKYYKKKFAREAEWEEWKERYYRLMERCHISYQSYAEEYEEFVSRKLKEQAKCGKAAESPKTRRDDYYSVLGVDRCASEEEIKRNFRVLIMQVHPDYCDDPDAEERARELIEAYQTLRNPQKRYLYDLSLH